MSEVQPLRLIGAFLVAVVIATVLGSIVQTQFNLAALNGIGAGIGPGTNLAVTFRDVFSGFSPTYGVYVVVPSLLVAFACAWLIVQRTRIAPWVVFAIAGATAILIGIPLVNYLSPVALLVGASRDLLCTVLMAAGGLVAGLVFSGIAAAEFDRADRAAPA